MIFECSYLLGVTVCRAPCRTCAYPRVPGVGWSRGATMAEQCALRLIGRVVSAACHAGEAHGPPRALELSAYAYVLIAAALHCGVVMVLSLSGSGVTRFLGGYETNLLHPQQGTRPIR